MRRDDAQTRSLLAAEYALGTMRGRARTRFERMLEGDAALRDEVTRWEAYLYELMRTDVQPEAPDEGVFRRVQLRLGLVLDRDAVMPPGHPGRSRHRHRHRRRRWPLTAAAALLLGLALMLMMPERLEHPEPIDPVAEARPVTTLQLDREAVAWHVGLHDGRVVVWLPDDARVDPGANADYELWWVGDDAPLSLGVLPRHGAVIRTLHDEVPEDLAAGALAISLEARGGSTTGAPAEVLAAFPL